jgi:hypothetical protein
VLLAGMASKKEAERENAIRVATVNSAKKRSWKESLGRNARSAIRESGRLIRLGLCVLLWGFPAMALAQSPQPPVVQGGQSGVTDAREPEHPLARLIKSPQE